MATTFKTDSAGSCAFFEKFTRRALEMFGFKNLISLENDNPLRRLLDCSCGIDAAGIKDGDTMFIASRVIEVKPYGSDYDCFSVRNKRLSGNETELAKLKRKIKLGLPRPQWHVQTFVSKAKDMATVAIVRTRELVDFILAHKPIIKPTRDKTEFWLARWQDLIRTGVKVTTFTIDGNGKKITA